MQFPEKKSSYIQGNTAGIQLLLKFNLKFASIFVWSVFIT